MAVHCLSAIFKISQKCQIAPRQMRCSSSECTKTCFRPRLCSEPRLGWGSFECSSDSWLYWQYLHFFCYKLVSVWAAVEFLVDRTTNRRAYGIVVCHLYITSGKALRGLVLQQVRGLQFQGLKVCGRSQRAECVCRLLNVWPPVWVPGVYRCRIDPLRFLAGWHKRRLNQAFSIVLV